VNLHFPYGFNGRGRTAGDDEDGYVRGLIEQVLFTSPGERVMRPDFGAGLLQLVFEPNSAAIAGTAQFLVMSGLQRHLAHLIAVESVNVEPLDATLQVTIVYRVIEDGSVQQAGFAVPPGGGGP
jgi:phage baseplate assembly protein W